MAPEANNGREAGVVIPLEAIQENPAIAEVLRQLRQQWGHDLKAHIPQE